VASTTAGIKKALWPEKKRIVNDLYSGKPKKRKANVGGGGVTEQAKRSSKVKSVKDLVVVTVFLRKRVEAAVWSVEKNKGDRFEGKSILKINFEAMVWFWVRRGKGEQGRRDTGVKT